jgi:hypothetical protein
MGGAELFLDLAVGQHLLQFGDPVCGDLGVTREPEHLQAGQSLQVLQPRIGDRVSKIKVPQIGQPLEVYQPTL